MLQIFCDACAEKMCNNKQVYQIKLTHINSERTVLEDTDLHIFCSRCGKEIPKEETSKGITGYFIREA